MRLLLKSPSSRASFLAATLVLLAPAPPVHATPEPALTAQDFAYGRSIELEQEGGLQHLRLPLEVLAALSPARTELRVYNEEHKLVPYALRVLENPAPREVAHAVLPFFPVRTTSPAPKLDSRLLTYRGPDGTLLNVELAGDRAGDATSTPPEVAFYLLDTSRLTAPVAHLRFELSAEATTFVWPITLEESNDLSTFSPLTRGTLARLRHGREQIDALELPLPPTRAKYLRMSWNGSPPAALREAHALLAPPRAPAPTLTTTIPGTLSAADGYVDFDAPASLTTRTLQLRLPVENTFVKGKLLGKNAPEDEYVVLAAGVFYRLKQEGADFTSSPIALRPQRALRYFRFEVESEAGRAALDPAPSLAVSAAVEQLLFVPRGSGPFQLAYGRHSAPRASLSANELTLTTGPEGIASDAPDTAKLGPRHELAGDAALQPPRHFPTLKIALWSALVGALALLAAITWHLWKTVNSTDVNPKT